MNSYVTLKDFANRLGINKGDIILVSSDSKRLMYNSFRNGDTNDLNDFIDGLIDKVGSEGTVVFPTYNWDFCKGITYDYRKTESRTGYLSSLALKRGDFKRTKHAIYSFAVCGKRKDELCNKDYTDSFGSDSIFSFFRNEKAKNVIIDINLKRCFTYYHYVDYSCNIRTAF